MKMIVILWVIVSVVTFGVILWSDFQCIKNGEYRYGDWCLCVGGVLFAPVMWAVFAVGWAVFAVGWCWQGLTFYMQARKRQHGDLK